MSISDEVTTLMTFEYLKNTPTDQVYMHLKSNAENKYMKESNDYMKIESLLLTLNDPLVNLGLAQYGYNCDVLRELYSNGNKAIRLATLMNRKDSYRIFGTENRSWIDSDLIKTIISSDDENEKYALLSNPLIGETTLQELLEKKLTFQSVTESNWQNLLVYVRNHMLLQTEYSYPCILKAAWKLADTVPVTKEWARTLWFLLTNTYPLFDIKLAETIRRWESLGDDSADIRMILVRQIHSNEKENYKNSDENYIRQAYYQSFDTSDPDKLQTFFNKDKELFLNGAIYNENLYRDPAVRDKLRSLTLATENGGLSDYYRFNREVEKYESGHPEWFEDITVLAGDSANEDVECQTKFAAQNFKKLGDIHNLVYLTFLMVGSIVAGIVAYLISK